MSIPAANAPSPTGRYDIAVDASGDVRVERITAESEVRLVLARAQGGHVSAEFDVAPSIDVRSFPALLETLAQAADLHLEVTFRATKLSSSHVVLEDTGLTLGAALFETMRQAMEQGGVNGAGSSLRTAEEFAHAGVSASVSVEGRKFLKLVSATTLDDQRWRVLLGHMAFGGVRTEDIDDFIDAVAGGMRASIFVHERKAYASPDAFWRDVTQALGRAIGEALEPNPARKGLPPGVKATLF